MYLKRHIDSDLGEWRNSLVRMPLLLRGARQVGKTESVRNLGSSFENFIEVNFEKNKRAHAVFESDLSPYEICENLSAIFKISIEPGKTLLFFDEIQSCIPVIRSLRFFYEEMPELHVIAAGSLLEFALLEIPSFGVGRIRSLFMYPMSFDEFLLAVGEDILLEKKRQATPENPLHQVLHEKLLELQRKFTLLGGMPKVISTYVRTGDFSTCYQVLDDLIISLQDDFGKYKERVPASRVREVFESVIMQNGNKFIFSKAAIEANHRQVKEALELLVLAGLVIPVKHTSANGLPLGAEVNPKKQKMLLIDTGMFLAFLDFDPADIILSSDLDLINKGGVDELFVGLEFQKKGSPFKRRDLYYWHREALNSNAEVDYVISSRQRIVPVEVKAGKRGAMQSLYLFLKEKDREKGIRISTENFASYDSIEVYPLYAVSNIK